MTDAHVLRADVAGRRSQTDSNGFAELLCAEPAWLQDEFAAIITANFGPSAFDPDLPPPPPHRDIPAAPRPGRRESRPVTSTLSTDADRTARRVGARERSPPPTRRSWKGCGPREEVVPTAAESRPMIKVCFRSGWVRTARHGRGDRGGHSRVGQPGHRPGRPAGRTAMSFDKPWNDVADQLRPARPDLDEPDLDVAGEEPSDDPSSTPEADPADVADQRRVVPLPDDQPWP
ncbi:hypothetical protein [Kutzneria kofuensis]